MAEVTIKSGRQILLAKWLVILGLIIMIASAIAEFILGGDAFIASEILGLGLSQVGIVLWSTNVLMSQIADSRNLILTQMKEVRESRKVGRK